MIYGEITHPDVLKALASAGHGANILIADGHFPMSVGVAPEVPRVFLNFAPGMLTVPDVLRQLVKAIPIESATGAIHDDGKEPAIWPEYKEILPKNIELRKVKASDLGNLVNTPKTALVIATGEPRTHACIMLTMGLRKF